MSFNKNMSGDALGNMPISSLVIKMATPLIISMFLQACYNLTDSIFVAALSEDALTAVTLAFPIQIAIIGISVGTSVGVGAITSRRFGEKKIKEASDTAKTGIILAIFSWILMLIFVLFTTDNFVISQISDKKIINYAISYIKICGILSIGIFLQIMMERLLQSTGKSILSMYCQIAGVVINIILDPILIFGYFGVPKLEVTGAALATVLGQITGMIIGLILNLFYNKEVNFNFKDFKIKLNIVKEIYLIAIPSVIIQVIGSIMIFFMNKILIKISVTTVAVFGAYFKLNGFVFMPVFAMNSALTPIISYNFGAKNKNRIKDAISFGTKISVFIMLIGTLIFQIIPHLLLNMFKPSAEFMRIGIPALRIISLIFPLIGFSISMGALFQSVGRAYYSMIITFMRQIIILLPTAYILSNKFALKGVWWSFLISEAVALIFCIIFYFEIDRNILKKIGQIKDENV